MTSLCGTNIPTSKETHLRSFQGSQVSLVWGHQFISEEGRMSQHLSYSVPLALRAEFLVGTWHLLEILLPNARNLEASIFHVLQFFLCLFLELVISAMPETTKELQNFLS